MEDNQELIAAREEVAAMMARARAANSCWSWRLATGKGISMSLALEMFFMEPPVPLESELNA